MLDSAAPLANGAAVQMDEIGRAVAAHTTASERITDIRDGLDGGAVHTKIHRHAFDMVGFLCNTLSAATQGVIGALRAKS